MRVFIAVLVLIFSLQSWTKADDIRDFQIEGMSIGDSLLDYVAEDEIENKRSYFKSLKGVKKEYSKTFLRENLKTYESVYIYFKSDDEKYIIQSLAGRTYFKNNIEDCYKLQKTIRNEIREILSNAKEKKGKRELRGTKGTVNAYDFDFKDGSAISISCYDYTDKKKIDRLSVFLLSSHYADFQTNRAFK